MTHNASGELSSGWFNRKPGVRAARLRAAGGVAAVRAVRLRAAGGVAAVGAVS